MTIFELLLILFWIGGGALIGSRVAAHFDPSKTAAGGIIGALLGFGTMLLIGQVWAWLDREHPPCKCGKNSSSDFRISRDADWGFVDECACGLRYLRRVSLWYEILPNGDAQPYMQRDFWGHWKPATETNIATQVFKRPVTPRVGSEEADKVRG